MARRRVKPLPLRDRLATRAYELVGTWRAGKHREVVVALCSLHSASAAFVTGQVCDRLNMGQRADLLAELAEFVDWTDR